MNVFHCSLQMTCSGINVKNWTLFLTFHNKYFSDLLFTDITLKGAFLWQIIKTQVFFGLNPTMDSYNIIKNT